MTAMTPERQTLLMIRGTISELSPEEQARINAIAAAMRKQVETAEGMMALALVGAEISVQP